MNEADLMKVRAFGKTSLREVKRKLADLGLSLDMDVPESGEEQMDAFIMPEDDDEDEGEDEAATEEAAEAEEDEE
jgi:hypothetical protein